MIPLGSAPSWVAGARLDDDDFGDLAVVGGDEPPAVRVLLGEEFGLPSGPVVTETVEFPFRVAVGDFDSDSVLDLATLNTCYDACADPRLTIVILLGNGSGLFEEAAFFEAGGAQADSTRIGLAVGDLNADGVDDIAAVNGYDDALIVLLSDP